ncbi:hypothetical protein [Halorubrum sp. FL23]|uniref:hypothetical protein n=1 Tax=Halorubrum sp. FL23 TaxID=3458704 RepID=UPI004034579D
MSCEPAGYLDLVKDAVGRGQFKEARRVRSVRAVDPERRADTAEDVIEEQRLDRRYPEVVVNVDECDTRGEFRKIGGRSSRGSHGHVDGESCKKG